MTVRRKILMIVAAIALLLSTHGATSVLAVDNPVVYDTWQSGNAAFECSQIGEYTYAWKIDEGGAEGAPNGSETANFYDPDGNLMHSNTITISNSDGKVFDWSSAPNGIGAVIVKAGTGANVWFYSPQAKSDTGLYGYQGKDISHVTFCWNPDYTPPGEWCSPGYWRQPHHLDSWEATGISPDELYSDYFGEAPTRNKQGERNNAPTDPTLWDVLQMPQYYGGDAFNAVGDLLSNAHPDVNFLSERIEDSCPLN
jgi:hypothetical protein